MDVIELIEKHIDEICRVQILAKKFKRKNPKDIGKDNEILQQKTKEAHQQEQNLADMRKEIEYI